MSKSINLSLALLITLAVSFSYLISASVTSAAGVAACPCQLSDSKRPDFCPYVACKDLTNTFSTLGHCVAPGICKAESTSGKDGFGLDKVMQLLGPLMQQLMKSGQGAGSSPSNTPTSGTTNPGCTQYYQVTVPTTDPCAYYVPSVSSSLGDTGTSVGVSDQLLNALGGTASNVSDTLNTTTNTNTNTNINASTSTNTATVVSTSTSVTPGTTTIVNLLPGVRGDIQVLGGGATVLAGSRDAASNSEVAGFYGADTFGGQPTGVVGQLCQNRPWATNFLSAIIPPTFFDGLCSFRGYQVGVPQAVVVPKVTVTQSFVQPVVKTVAATSTTPYIEPKVDIWAVPATVPLGSRTSVFWNTQGVTNCTETSPDGSFSQTSLSGGASTVAITGDTTFTISCLAPDGSHATDFVTVRLSI